MQTRFKIDPLKEILVKNGRLLEMPPQTRAILEANRK
jgi:hypothetical protein